MAARKALAVFVSVVLAAGLTPGFAAWGNTELQDEGDQAIDASSTIIEDDDEGREEPADLAASGGKNGSDESPETSGQVQWEEEKTKVVDEAALDSPTLDLTDQAEVEGPLLRAPVARAAAASSVGKTYEIVVEYSASMKWSVKKNEVAGKTLLPGDTIRVLVNNYSVSRTRHNLTLHTVISGGGYGTIYTSSYVYAPAYSTKNLIGQYTLGTSEALKYYPDLGNFTTNINVFFTTTAVPKVTLTFSPNGSSGGGKYSDTVRKTVALNKCNVSAPARDGYAFSGWNTLSTGAGNHYKHSDNYTLQANATLYAEWTRTANLVTGPIGWAYPDDVVYYYDADGMAYYDGSPDEPVDVSIDADEDDGWTALGWTKDAGALTPAYDPEFTISDSDLNSSSTSYYAIGKRNLLLSYDSNDDDATGDVPDAQGGGEQIYNASGKASSTSGVDTFTVASPGSLALDGCVFAGWNTEWDGSGTAYAAGDTATVSEPTTLYAQWAYPVTYNVNGGKEGTAPAEQMKLPGKELTLHSGKPSRDPDTADITTTLVYNYSGAPAAVEKTTKRSEAWTFKEWNTATDGSGDTYAPGGTYTDDKAATLYAQWQVQNPTYASTALPTPTRDGYDFLGWTPQQEPTDEELAAALEGGATYTPTADGALYAQWKVKTYDVTYDANGGSSTPEAQTKTHGQDLTLADEITRTNDTSDVTLTLNYKGGAYVAGADGNTWASNSAKTATVTTTYSFQGWDESSSAATASYTAGGSYADNASATLYAIWKGETTGYGTYKLPDANRTSVTSVTYQFKGWTTAEYSSKKFNEIPSGKLWERGADFGPVEEDTTLYAVWDPPTYAIEYDGNGGGDTVTDVPEAQNKEADQDGFTLQSGVPERKAAKSEFTVTYDANGGSVTTNDTNTKAANGVTYKFSMWNTRTDGNGTWYSASQAYTDNNDLKLYAHWNVEGSVDPVMLPTPTRDGYDFLGWYTDATGNDKVKDTEGKYTPSGDITLYAQWKAHEYNVTYDANTDSATVTNMPDPTSVPKTHDIPLTLSDKEPSRGDETGTVGITYDTHGGSECTAGSSNYTSKYDFLSWKATNGTSYAPGSTYKANEGTTLKADWAEETAYAAVQLPDTTREGHTFLGWFTAETGGDKVGDAGDEYTPSAKGDVTLHAHWEVHTYPVSYDMNTTDTVSNQPDPNPATKTYGVDLALAGAPTRADEPNSSLTVTFDRRGGTGSPDSITAAAVTKHNFTGWNTQADGNGTAYEAEASYAGNTALQLYAQWEDTATGAEVELPAAPTPPTGFTFKGWSLSKDTAPDDTSGALLSPGAKVQPTGDVTYYAIYDPPLYIVHYDANGGTGAPADQYKKHDEELSLVAADPTRADVDETFGIIYDPAGGSAAKVTDSVNMSTSYEFAGWAEDATVGSAAGIVTDDEWNGYDDGKKHANGDTYTANADLDLFAQWKETVVKNPNTVTLPTADRPGYKFLGWYDENGSKVGGAGDSVPVPDEATTYQAKWEAYDYPSDGKAFAYTVVFENPEGTEVATQDFTFGESQALNAGTLTPPSSDKVFAGWKLKGGSTTFTEHQLVSNLTNEPDGKVYLVATWKDAPTGSSGGGGTDDPIDPDDPNSPVNPNGYNYYTVEYYEQDTDGETYNIKSKDWIFEDADTEVAVPASALDAPLGFHVDAGRTFASGTVASDNSTKLEVYWARNQFDVTFLPGATDATGTMDDQHFVWASGKKLNANAFSRPGYTFTGWVVTERDSLGPQSMGGMGIQSIEVAFMTVQAVGDSVADKADGSRLTSTDGGHVTLTAQWKKDANSPSGPGNPTDPDNPDNPDDPNNPDDPKKELEELVKKADDIVGPIGPDGPTDPQKKLLDEIEAAKKLLNDPDATADQLRDEIARLTDAIAAFEAANGNGGPKASRVRPAAGKSPGTGDPMVLVSEGLAVMLLLSAAAATIALRLRNRASRETGAWTGDVPRGEGGRRSDVPRGRHSRR